MELWITKEPWNQSSEKLFCNETDLKNLRLAAKARADVAARLDGMADVNEIEDERKLPANIPSSLRLIALANAGPTRLDAESAARLDGMTDGNDSEDERKLPAVDLGHGLSSSASAAAGVVASEFAAARLDGMTDGNDSEDERKLPAVDLGHGLSSSASAAAGVVEPESAAARVVELELDDEGVVEPESAAARVVELDSDDEIVPPHKKFRRIHKHVYDDSPYNLSNTWSIRAAFLAWSLSWGIWDIDYCSKRLESVCT
jgi:hypothetical protein